MNVILSAYIALADLNLWIKTNLNEQLTLTDIPSIISNRFVYIVENWSTIKIYLLNTIDSYTDPARLKSEIDKFESIAVIYRADSSKKIPPLSNLLDNYYSVFDSMMIDDIPVSTIEQKKIDSEVARVQSFIKNDFIDIRKKLESGRDAVADTVGATDTDYNRIYGRSPLPALLNRSILQVRVSLAFQKAIQSIEDILANENILKTQAFIDPFAFARANANNPDIDIESFSSGRLTKLNYGESLRTLAYRTMEDSEKWIEIAIANGLKPPYIDEIGESVYIVANAKGNTINVSKTDANGIANKEKFYVNQIVILQSDVCKTPDQRLVVNIRETPISGELVIELNGESDLDKYKKIDNSYVRVYKPNTINSNFYILIPSTEEAPQKIKEDPWFLKSKSEDEKKAGIDLLLNSDCDLVFSPLGEISLSYGVDNANQAVKILMNTSQGDLVQYLDYGMPLAIGEKNTSQDDVKRQLSEEISRQIGNDSRFDRLDYLSVEYIGALDSPSAYRIVMGVVLAGGSTVIPISFSVNVS